MANLKPDVQMIKKGELRYLVESGNQLVRFKPWLGDKISFLYDLIMSKSVFPKKFGGDIQKHYHILTQELADIRGRTVLELGTGSGSAVSFLSSDNQYTGTDISPGLLKQAAKRFQNANFSNPEFYVVSADDLPFETNNFEVCLCILSLNFIGNVAQVLKEVSRVLLPDGLFVCSVPVPERNKHQSTIRGVLYSEAELEKICHEYGFTFTSNSSKNGALLYFRAVKQR